MNTHGDDYIVIVNSVDMSTGDFTFLGYRMAGSGIRYPDMNTTDINKLINILRFPELKEGRIIMDIISCIIPGVIPKVHWETEGLEGTTKDIPFS